MRQKKIIASMELTKRNNFAIIENKDNKEYIKMNLSTFSEDFEYNSKFKIIVSSEDKTLLEKNYIELIKENQYIHSAVDFYIDCHNCDKIILIIERDDDIEYKVNFNCFELN